MSIKITPSDSEQPIHCDNVEEAVQVHQSITRANEPLPEDVQDLLKKYPYLGDVINDRSLTPFQKKMKMLPLYKDVRERREDIVKEKRQLDVKVEYLQRFEAAPGIYEPWKELEPKLEKNDCSRLHLLVASLKEQYRHMPDLVKNGNPKDYPWQDVMPFVVQHDWAAAFKNATDYHDGVFNLPFARCAFEFRISGLPCIVLAGQNDKDTEINFQLYVGIQNGLWLSEDNEKEQPKAKEFAIGQIKALCVALDAEVATRDMVRVSEKVNRKRAQEGREPFYSYHVISLHRRYRVGNPSSGGPSQGKRRLHFRRGHWRHYAEFKTWVRWTLVGNPELGFIDKEYRL